jgi:hypothetical protein
LICSGLFGDAKHLFGDICFIQPCRNLNLQAVRPWGPAQAYGVTFAHDDEEIFTASRSDYASVGVVVHFSFVVFFLQKWVYQEMATDRPRIAG